MAQALSTFRSRMTSLVAGSALMLAGSVSPAQASDDQLLRLLLGAAAVAVVVHGAQRAQSQPRAQHRPDSARGLPQHCRETLSIHRRHVPVYNAQCLQRAGLRHLPRQCHEVLRTDRGQRAVYRARCLERHYSPPRGQAAPHRPRADYRQRFLPDRCRTHYHYRGQRLIGYQAACLQRAGLRNLPATCQVRRHDGGLYSARCLQERGYRRR